MLDEVGETASGARGERSGATDACKRDDDDDEEHGVETDERGRERERGRASTCTRNKPRSRGGVTVARSL